MKLHYLLALLLGLGPIWASDGDKREDAPAAAAAATATDADLADVTIKLPAGANVQVIGLETSPEGAVSIAQRSFALSLDGKPLDDAVFESAWPNINVGTDFINTGTVSMLGGYVR